MLGKKKIAGLLTIAALLAACGGGGGGSDKTAADTGTGTGTGAGAGAGAGTGSGSGSGTGTDTGSGPGPGTGTGQQPDNTQNPGNQPGTDTGQQPADTQLSGRISMVANQLVFVKADRSYYNAIQLEEFETGGGLLDAAAGGTGTETPPANDEDGVWVQPSAIAPVAPIAALGLRIDRFVQPVTGEAAVGGQTAVGRLAFNLVELPDSPEIRGTDVAEQLSFVLDGVELSTNAQGELTGVRVRENSQIHVVGRTATGNEIRESLPAGVQSVRLLPVSEVLDNYGDTSSTVLLLDLEHAFAQAGSRLAGLELLSGRFSLDLTLSAARIVRPEEGSLPARDLNGKSITVTGRPVVNGAGISGTAWIRAYP